ncbi:MAG: hypothetical protein GY788_10105 [bacterium]|nr:hypothetical protein [bacterium]
MAFPWAGHGGPFDPKNGEVLNAFGGFVAGSFASIGAVIPYVSPKQLNPGVWSSYDIL